MKIAVGAAATALVLSACATTPTLAPLGSMGNPVRVQGPSGERAYLDRLRCPDGTAPGYERRGSGGPAGDGHIIDFYTVTCPGSGAIEIVMDMYHGNRENRPVPGFTITE